MKVAYVAGAYRDPRGAYYIGRNIEAARAVGVELWRLGFAVIVPHLNTAFMDGACPDAVWLEGAKELLRRSDIVVLVPNWVGSEGTHDEKTLAEQIGIPVVAWDDIEAQSALIQALAGLDPSPERVGMRITVTDPTGLRAAQNRILVDLKRTMARGGA